MPLIDEQHQKLVELLNQLASHAAYQSDPILLNSVFDELADYAVYHFQTEEAIWHEYLPQDAMEIRHKEVHNAFISTITSLGSREDNKPLDGVLEETLAFLIRWLASHILETDRHMAKVALAMQSGMPLEAAKKKAREEMTDSSRVLMDIILATCGNLVTNTLHLIREVAERKAQEQELRHAIKAREDSAARMQSLMDTALDAVIGTDGDGRVISWNPQAEVIFGYTKEQVLGCDVAELIVPAEHREAHRNGRARFVRSGIPSILGKRIEIGGQRADGSVFPMELTVTALMQNGLHFFCAYARDITDRKKAEETIYDLAYYDLLTSLPNRRLLHDRLQQTLLAVVRTKRYGAILHVDIDNFKALNDASGHDVGDLLLKEVAKRLQSAVHADDTVARVGGDDFVVVLNSIGEDAEQAAIQAMNVAQRIRASITQPFDLQSLEHHGSSSIGITLFREHESTVDELLKYADSSIHQARKSGRNSIEFFDPAMQAVLESRAEMESWMAKALNEQYRLHYQVQVNDEGRANSAEVLIRWHHPERGTISPVVFIPLAEETGLILHIGHWVLKTACAQLKTWDNDEKFRHLTLAVNVSAKQFQQPDFVAQVMAVLEQTGANPEKLKLELTESTLAVDVDDIIGKMNALKAMGVKFSLDDFGTGFSSLSYLKRLPIDQLKIDQSFVRDALIDPSDAAIVRTIIALGQSMGMEVIAEGVETEEQRSFLAVHGCRHLQGYLFSRPVPLAEFEQLLHLNTPLGRTTATA